MLEKVFEEYKRIYKDIEIKIVENGRKRMEEIIMEGDVEMED